MLRLEAPRALAALAGHALGVEAGRQLHLLDALGVEVQQRRERRARLGDGRGGSRDGDDRRVALPDVEEGAARLLLYAVDRRAALAEERALLLGADADAHLDPPLRREQVVDQHLRRRDRRRRPEDGDAPRAAADLEGAARLLLDGGDRRALLADEQPLPLVVHRLAHHRHRAEALHERPRRLEALRRPRHLHAAAPRVAALDAQDDAALGLEALPEVRGREHLLQLLRRAAEPPLGERRLLVRAEAELRRRGRAEVAAHARVLLLVRDAQLLGHRGPLVPQPLHLLLPLAVALRVVLEPLHLRQQRLLLDDRQRAALHLVLLLADELRDLLRRVLLRRRRRGGGGGERAGVVRGEDGEGRGRAFAR